VLHIESVHFCGEVLGLEISFNTIHKMYKFNRKLQSLFLKKQGVFVVNLAQVFHETSYNAVVLSYRII
jgi:hypothetical protein